LGLPAVFAAAHGLSHDSDFNERAILDAFTQEYFGATMAEFAAATAKAQRAFPLGDTNGIREAERLFLAGQEPLSPFVEEFNRKSGGREAAIMHLRETLAGYHEARDSFHSCRRRASRNVRNLDFWLEGLDANEFYGRFMLAVLTDRLATERQGLLSRIEQLEAATARLFGETYMPLGVADEVCQRYAFFRAYLDTIGDGRQTCEGKR